MTGRVAPGVDPASHSRSVLPTTPGPREPASDAQYREATAELTVKPTHAAAKHQVGCPGSGGRSACTEESESGAESGERAAGERRSAGASSGSVAQCSGRV